MLPEILENILTEKNEEQPIDECRVSISADSDFIHVTHYLEVPAKVCDLIEASKKNLLGEVTKCLPECVYIQTLPQIRAKKKVSCVCLTLRLNAKHNRIEDIKRVAEMAEYANITVVRKISANIMLENIHKDMKPYE